MSRKGKCIEIESQLVVWGWEVQTGLTANGHKDLFWGNGNLDFGDDCTTQFPKNH